MTVNIDPSEVRSGSSSTRPAKAAGLRLPGRVVMLGGLGGAGLIAFSVGAFSFFSTLADPRVRLPRPMPAAASMPDLKDGMPALVTGEPAAAKATALNLPRPEIDEQAARPQPAVVPPQVEKAAIAAPTAPRAEPTAPPIQNAATVPEARTVTPVVPPSRTVATIAPARTETVKAKPAHVATATPAASPDPVPEPTSTATATAQPARKPVAGKPAVQKAAARKAPSARTVADAQPAAPVAEASAASDESEIPGARQFRAGVKALGGLFGGESSDD